MATPTPKLHGIVESLLRRVVFKSPAHTQTGLQTNLWWWTHTGEQEMNPANGHITNPTEALLVKGLFSYLVKHIAAEKILVCSPSPHHQDMSVQTTASIEDADVVVVSLCYSQQIGRMPTEVREWLGDILSEVRKVVVLVSHDAWVTCDVAEWKELNEAVRKLNDAEFELSASSGRAGGPRVSMHLPLCCPRHPQVRSVASSEDYKVTLENAFCPMPCFRPYQGCSHQEKHLCLETCHVHKETFPCPYPCERVLRCTPHVCAMLCHQACDCLHFSSTPLPCFHEREDGQKEQHVYIGSACCVEDVTMIPCQTRVPVLCQSCRATVYVPCSNAAGWSQDCQECAILRESIKKQVQIEETTKFENHARAEQERMAAFKNDQHMAARHGVFLIGQTVYVSNPRFLVKKEAALVEWPETVSGLWHEGDLVDGQAAVVKSRALSTEHNQVIYLLVLRNDAKSLACVCAMGLLLAQPLLHAEAAAGAAEGPLLITGGNASDTSQHEAGTIAVVVSDTSRGSLDFFPEEKGMLWPDGEPLPLGTLAIVKANRTPDGWHLIQLRESGRLVVVPAGSLAPTVQPGQGVQLLSVTNRVIPGTSEARNLEARIPGLYWSQEGLQLGQVMTVAEVFSAPRMPTRHYVALVMDAKRSRDVSVLPLSSVESSKEWAYEDQQRRRKGLGVTDSAAVMQEALTRFEERVAPSRAKNVAKKIKITHPTQAPKQSVQQLEDQKRCTVAGYRGQAMAMESKVRQWHKKLQDFEASQKNVDNKDYEVWKKLANDDALRRVSRRPRGMGTFYQ